MYLDSAYLAKFYVNEPDATAVRELIRTADHVMSSAWALLEVTCVFQRHVREGSLSGAQGQELSELFHEHVAQGIWTLEPVTDSLLRLTAGLIRGLPPTVPLRAGGAIHVATALAAGEPAIWTNDRHLLAVAPHFGLKGRQAGGEPTRR